MSSSNAEGAEVEKILALASLVCRVKGIRTTSFIYELFFEIVNGGGIKNEKIRLLFPLNNFAPFSGLLSTG